MIGRSCVFFMFLDINEMDALKNKTKRLYSFSSFHVKTLNYEYVFGALNRRTHFSIFFHKVEEIGIIFLSKIIQKLIENYVSYFMVLFGLWKIL